MTRTSPVAAAYRFAGFELRPGQRMLLQHGKSVTVGPRAFDLLVALVQGAGGLVTKDELLERVWPKLVVEENNLQVQVSALRKVVGSDAIATVAGHGYRFVTPVSAHGEDAGVEARPAGLPRAATTFVGRSTELEECATQLAQARLLTLVGVGGIGKTRLAIEIAAAAAPGFANGIAFVELAPLEDPRSVMNAIASTLGVGGDPARSLVDSVLRYLADREQLIVLDNCEHLLSACAAIAVQLLRAAGGLRLLATSREPLRVAGETVYQVPTLPVPGGGTAPLALRDFAAAALFVDRVSAVDRGFNVTPDNVADIAAICRKVDGIPLALELAASRVRAMPLKVIEQHLDEQFRLLVGGDRSALPRQQTLRATLDWSYRLLSEPEQSLFRALSVFAGGFPLDAAQVVGAGPHVREADVLYLLAELVDKSLVMFELARNRYRLLEPVRQYAMEKLGEAGEEGVVRDRHLRFYVAFAGSLAPQIRGPRQGELLVQVEVERDNFAAAFAHARDSADGGPDGLTLVFPTLTALSNSGHIDLSRRLAREALAHAGAQEGSVARCRALYVTAFMDFWAGRYQEAQSTAEESVRMARAIGDKRLLAEALYRLGNTTQAIGDSAQARMHLEEQLRLATEVGDRQLMADAHGGLSEVDSIEGRLEAAQEHRIAGLELNPDEFDGVIIGSCNIARDALVLGTHDVALRHLRGAIAALGEVRGAVYAQCVLNLTAALAVAHRDWARALRLFGAAVSHSQRTGWKNPEPDASFSERARQRAHEGAGAVADEAFAAGAALDEETAFQEAAAWLASLPQA